MIQPMTLPVGAIFYLEYTYGLDARMEKILREAGIKIWNGKK